MTQNFKNLLDFESPFFRANMIKGFQFCSDFTESKRFNRYVKNASFEVEKFIKEVLWGMPIPDFYDAPFLLYVMILARCSYSKMSLIDYLNTQDGKEIDLTFFLFPMQRSKVDSISQMYLDIECDEERKIAKEIAEKEIDRLKEICDPTDISREAFENAMFQCLCDSVAEDSSICESNFVNKLKVTTKEQAFLIFRLWFNEFINGMDIMPQYNDFFKQFDGIKMQNDVLKQAIETIQKEYQDVSEQLEAEKAKDKTVIQTQTIEGVPEEEHLELERKYQKEQRKYASLSEKYQRLKEELEFKEIEEESDSEEEMNQYDHNLHYVFVADREARDSVYNKVLEAFPNSKLVSNLEQLKQTNPDCVLLWAKYMKHHSLFYETRNYCQTHNIPYRSVKCNNPERLLTILNTNQY